MTQFKESEFIIPDWPAPDFVNAAITTRVGGLSEAPFDAFNLGDHVGDDPDIVAKNRLYLTRKLNLPQRPIWMRQVHGVSVLDASYGCDSDEADAIVSMSPHGVCAVLTADCLPVLFCHPNEHVIAAAHAGWRGLAKGVLENTVKAMRVHAQEIIAYLGPAIGAKAFEVDQDVVDCFVSQKPEAIDCFENGINAGKYLADIYALARMRLNHMGIEQIYGGDFCTLTESERFYSYRRDGSTGRMASLIWFNSNEDSIGYADESVKP